MLRCIQVTQLVELLCSNRVLPELRERQDIEGSIAHEVIWVRPAPEPLQVLCKPPPLPLQIVWPSSKCEVKLYRRSSRDGSRMDLCRATASTV